ncbi:octapeptide-repeat protein T2-like [Narcine bancroftii]|uniref:octapeptide-repeat protein T2-like n=1 Tax=Narcine bancroftii TaxID=1343680 RepID=UPI003831331D
METGEANVIAIRLEGAQREYEVFLKFGGIPGGDGRERAGYREGGRQRPGEGRIPGGREVTAGGGGILVGREATAGRGREVTAGRGRDTGRSRGDGREGTRGDDQERAGYREAGGDGRERAGYREVERRRLAGGGIPGGREAMAGRGREATAGRGWDTGRSKGDSLEGTGGDGREGAGYREVERRRPGEGGIPGGREATAGRGRDAGRMTAADWLRSGFSC